MSETDAARAQVLALLDEAAAASVQIRFWWRDDDAKQATPELARLLRIASAHRLPLALAVIPGHASENLVAAIEAAPEIAVLQHGWSHQRHNPADEKKAELGDHRPAEAVLAELSEGRRRLEAMFGDRFLPVLVPPWNRIGEAVRARCGEARLVGLSTFGACRADERQAVNTHLDIIDWTVRGGVSPSAAYVILAREIRRRLDGSAEPIGLLTHHLVHDDAAWRLLDELLALLSAHPAACWPRIDALFALREEPIWKPPQVSS